MQGTSLDVRCGSVQPSLQYVSASSSVAQEKSPKEPAAKGPVTCFLLDQPLILDIPRENTAAPGQSQDKRSVADKRVTTLPRSPGRGGGIENAGDADGTDDEGAGGRRDDDVGNADNRAETMGVSLGPVAQGHVVGVGCMPSPTCCFWSGQRFIVFLFISDLCETVD